jgi:hypothetical protein
MEMGKASIVGGYSSKLAILLKNSLTGFVIDFSTKE